jgi:hypothetical protein
VTKYRCTNCGRDNSLEVNAAHPSLDDRYPIGHCLICTPWPKPKENPLKKGEFYQPPRKTITLIRADLFDQDMFDHQQKVKSMRELAAKLESKHASKMSESELSAAKAAVAWLNRQ